MKVNFVSFSDYNGDMEVYKLEKMDLFSFLLTKIIENGEDRIIKDILHDMDITDALMYLYQNNFYYLLDNKLIVNYSDSEDISKIRASEVKFSNFGKYCLKEHKIPLLEKSENRRVIYNPFKKEFSSDNKVIYNSNVVVYNEEIDHLKLINDSKKGIMNKYEDNFILNYVNVEADPYYYEMYIDSEKIDDNLKKILKDNLLKLDDDKKQDENKEFLSSNFRISLFYGRDRNLVNSDYYLIVNEDKTFEINGNKIYIENIIEEFNDYSFVEVSNETIGYNVSKIFIDDQEGSCVQKTKLKDYKGVIKKYLLRNRDKYKNDKIINKVIDLL